MNGIERMEKMYNGKYDGVPVSLFMSTEYMCRMSNIPDYRFLYSSPEFRAQAHIKMAELHDFDAMYVWFRGKRNDWREDYQLIEKDGEVYIWDKHKERKLPLSEDFYAICFPETPPYRKPFIQYGTSQELINGVPYFSMKKLNIIKKEDVDVLLPLETAEDIKKGGMIDGVKLIAEKLGNSVFLEPVCNSSFRFAIGYLGFQEGLIFMKEEPEVFQYLLDRVMRQEMEYLKVMASFGIHSAWITDIWADFISEKDYRTFVMPVARNFIHLSKELGIKSHYYIPGKISYHIDCVNELKPDAFHMEDSVGIDITSARKKLNNKIVMYGNLDSIEILTKGPIYAIEREVKRQIDICLPNGPFVVALKGEVEKYAPPEHVNAMIIAAHSYR
ncbi:MAG: uroporphyrinogen decarboxylase family protein [Clostridiales bacterium]|nr:uroporphyrinogen decarboxylase family protein [Clostridiales bacterium]